MSANWESCLMPGLSGTSGPHFTLPPSVEEGATAVVVERVIPPTLDWRQTVVLTLAGAAIAAVGIGLVWHRQLGLLLFGGIVLATAMNPFIEWFIRRLKMARVHAAILVYSLL